MSVLKGGKELQELLNQLPAKIEANVVRGGLRAGAIVIKNAIQDACPVDDGDLKNSVKVSGRIKKKYGLISYRVRVGDKKAWYAHLIEFGTKAHEIRAKDGKSLFIGGLMRTNIHHPGARPKPFIRPSFDQHEQQALDVATDYMRKRLKTKHGLETPDPEALLDES